MLGDRQITANFVKYRLTISLIYLQVCKISCMLHQPMETVLRESRESTGLTVETCIDGRGVSEATGFTQ